MSTRLVPMLMAGALGTCRVPALDSCDLYSPQAAKRTYDGRVGTVTVHNTSSLPAQVKLYHPDGTGEVEQDWMVRAGDSLTLTNPDRSAGTYGNDWGIQVNQSCIPTIGEIARWNEGRFTLRWDGDSLTAGPGDAK